MTVLKVLFQVFALLIIFLSYFSCSEPSQDTFHITPDQFFTEEIKENVENLLKHRPNSECIESCPNIRRTFLVNGKPVTDVAITRHHIISWGMELKEAFVSAYRNAYSSSIEAKISFINNILKFAVKVPMFVHEQAAWEDPLHFYFSVKNYYCWNNGNIIIGPITEKRADNPKDADDHGFDAPIFGQLTNEKRRNLICEAKKSLEAGDFFTFLQKWGDLFLLKADELEQIEWEAIGGGYYQVKKVHNPPFKCPK